MYFSYDKLRQSHSLTALLLVVLILLSGCGGSGAEEGTDEGETGEVIESTVMEDQVEIDLPDIRERDTLRAITSYSSTSYFLYKGQPMGYEYELLERLAEHLDMELQIVVADNLNQVFSMLHKGEGDLVAHGLTITKKRKQRVDFTEHHTVTKQVLVQRKPENWRKMKLHNIEKQLIRSPIKLIGEPVTVRRNSSYFTRLQNLSEEIGGDIDIREAPGIETEELIKQVADGEIKYTVADQNIAAINKTYMPELDIETAISFPQRIAWAVRKSSPQLKETLNEWIRSMRKQTDYYVIYNKYFKNQKAFATRARSEFFSKKGGRISEYDDLFINGADQVDWDWRLLAALSYQESQFNPKTESWAGARGLLQVMPRTAKGYGITDLFNPEESVKAGVAHIKALQKHWEKIPDSTERMKFVIGSYNAGQYHVEDARRLAEKYGADPDVWNDNVAEYLLKKAQEEFYEDPVVKYGYCRGSEPYKYVKEILDRYAHYQKFIDRDLLDEDSQPKEAMLR